MKSYADRWRGRRTDGGRKLTVCYGRGNYKQAPPQILLQGKWLEQAGFSAGDKITVKCQQGQPIITKDGTRVDSRE